MRLLISLVQSPSADLYDPRKSCTCFNDSPSWSTCTEILSCLPSADHHYFGLLCIDIHVVAWTFLYQIFEKFPDSFLASI